MLLDSNFIIYAAKKEHGRLRGWIAATSPVVSVVSYVEVLGYHQLTRTDQELFAAFFANTTVPPIDDAVAAEAVRLRQQHKMSLGDALIAGTAKVAGLSIATHNTKDFDWISDLECFDPLVS